MNTQQTPVGQACDCPDCHGRCGNPGSPAKGGLCFFCANGHKAVGPTPRLVPEFPRKWRGTPGGSGGSDKKKQKVKKDKEKGKKKKGKRGK